MDLLSTPLLSKSLSTVLYNVYTGVITFLEFRRLHVSAVDHAASGGCSMGWKLTGNRSSLYKFSNYFKWFKKRCENLKHAEEADNVICRSIWGRMSLKDKLHA